MRDETYESGAHTVELYVRSLSPGSHHATREELLGTLADLEASGRIDAHSVHVWGRQVVPDSAAGRTEPGRFIQDRIAAFREWADDRGVTLRSLAGTREVRSAFTDETYTARVLPEVVLAEYRGDDLQFVAPCVDGETTHTVADRLAAIAETGPPLAAGAGGGRRVTDRNPDAGADRKRCVTCGASVTREFTRVFGNDLDDVYCPECLPVDDRPETRVVR